MPRESSQNWKLETLNYPTNSSKKQVVHSVDVLGNCILMESRYKVKEGATFVGLFIAVS